MCGRFVKSGSVGDVARDVDLFGSVMFLVRLSEYLESVDEIMFHVCIFLLFSAIIVATIKWNDYVDNIIIIALLFSLFSVVMYAGAFIITDRVIKMLKEFQSSERRIFECCNKVIIGTPTVRVDDTGQRVVLEVKDARVIEKEVELPSFL